MKPTVRELRLLRNAYLDALVYPVVPLSLSLRDLENVLDARRAIWVEHRGCMCVVYVRRAAAPRRAL